ncbi:hypothetical protein [Succinivibrio dextrinosolvens]|uniref:hypothetical protein n=1 Tax=Succinivibrio dextrinosolvens TaxID=83771 RepID=UPI0013565B96|nr:hypothetical protein [Succinivibrio dextrinosolvens]
MAGGTSVNVKSICVVGVDGTGKSTVVRLLHTQFFPKSIVQYMGQKEWETKLARYIFDENNSIANKFIKKILKPIAVIYDLRHRVYKYKTFNEIIIFDRYADEQILQYEKYGKSIFNRPAEWLYNIFFKTFMYNPTLTVYLQCSIDTSLCRKNDINTDDEINRLKKSKMIMDKYYTKKSDLIIDTEMNSAEQVANIIYTTFELQKIR